MNKNIINIGIIGCGYIGAQLALYFSCFDKNIVVVEPVNNSIASAKKMHNEELDLRVSSGKITSEIKEDILNLMKFINDITTLPHTMDLVIEAVPEDLTLKQKIFT